MASHGHFRIVRAGVPVQVRGLVIQPGNVLHGEENGLLLVPREGLERIPERVDVIRTRERELLNFVRGADFTPEKLKGRIVE